MRNYFISTRLGPIVFCATEPTMQGRDPAILVIHGAFRSASTLAAWGQTLPNAIFANLPGHGGAPTLENDSLRAWTEAISEAIGKALPRKVLAVGESLGGLVALGLTGVSSVVAFDPFFRTDPLWPVRAAMREAMARGRASPAAAILAPGQTYYSQLNRLSAPAEIVTGDVPLSPERALERSPCLLEDEDLRILEGRVRLTRLTGGHRLIDEAPSRCRSIVLEAFGSMSANTDG